MATGLNNAQIIGKARELGINLTDSQADQILSQAHTQVPI